MAIVRTTITRDSHGRIDSARCECGATVTLREFTNECACGQLYNWAGQQLVPQSQWQEPWEDEG